MSELFEIEEAQIKKWLVNRKIVTTRETYTKPMNQVGPTLHGGLTGFYTGKNLKKL